MDKYDVGIIGAGIAGCCLAILLAESGKRVVVFEKDKYPTHKVCGEFISLESYDFFKELGLPLDDWNLPIIKNLRLTSQRGGELNANLAMGGFGLSRHKLDFELAKQMIKAGVHFHQSTKVTNAVRGSIFTSNGVYLVDLIIGAHGKYTPSYLKSLKSKRSKNYIGVKYHIRGNFRMDTISLHSFEGGYCGMSKIEADLFCLCYLVEADQLRKHKNSIKELEKNVLWKNEPLKRLFLEANFVWKKPMVISNIKFNKQQLYNDEMVFVGDAAGSISPLSGNGMSIAARSALLLYNLIQEELDFETLTTRYEDSWDRINKNRLNNAELLNRIMLNTTSHHFVLKLLNLVSPLRKRVIGAMNGNRIVRSS
jgi:flavin-dependent dehydrogenase